MPNENLGPAERIINVVLAYSDHLYHGRPGLVVADPTAPIGVKWTYATYRVEPRSGSPEAISAQAALAAAGPPPARGPHGRGAARTAARTKDEQTAAQAERPPRVPRPPIVDGVKVVYRLDKVGAKTNRVRIGLLGDDGKVREDGRVVGDYRQPGLFPEVAAWLYAQVADVWKIDNEFCARWASHAFGQEHRDLKVVLAAFMLVQGRKGDPVRDGDKIAFFDEDYRDVGEAMMLTYDGKAKGKADNSMRPKLLLRVRELLSLPEVAKINRDLGFGRSARHPFYGRWERAVEKWIRHREENPKILEGIVRSGARTTVCDLARCVGYKPTTPNFFSQLRWRQKQASDGRRTLDIGKEVAAAESWTGLTEEAICERIVRSRFNFKRVVGMIPKEVGLTRAIVAATIEAGGFSDKDLIQFTPTLEELGLMDVQDVRERWQRACKAADDMRAANVALRVRSKEVKEALADAVDTAVKSAVEEVMRGMRVYVVVDRSGSMQGSIEAAKVHIARFLQAFPPDQLHVSVFNTVGREVQIKHHSAAGVENAFRGIGAEGGTNHADGVRVLSKYPPKADEDSLIIFIGDEEDSHEHFAPSVAATGLRPTAFGLVRVVGPQSHGRGMAVRNTATHLGIPCFMIDERTFADPYAIPRTIRALIASTPVGAIGLTRAPAVVRKTLVETILSTDLLKRPTWAEV